MPTARSACSILQKKDLTRDIPMWGFSVIYTVRSILRREQIIFLLKYLLFSWKYTLFAPEKQQWQALPLQVQIEAMLHRISPNAANGFPGRGKQFPRTRQTISPYALYPRRAPVRPYNCRSWSLQLALFIPTKRRFVITKTAPLHREAPILCVSTRFLYHH